MWYHSSKGLTVSGNSRVSSWRDEVETSMYSSVMKGDQLSLDFEFLCQVGLKLLVDVINDSTTTVLLVDLVSIASSTHHCQT